ncbi:MAG: hypothetical protein ACE5HT_01725 [Gemmatimonadales bacterium]
MDSRHWPGLDREFITRLDGIVRSEEGIEFRESLGQSWVYSEGRPLPLGTPLLIRKDAVSALCQFAPAYHAAIERIITAYAESPEIQEVLAVPDDLSPDLDADETPSHWRVHLCRIDLLPDPDGGFYAIETNANCPGGLLFTGIASRQWRSFLEPRGFDLPAPMPNEAENWMAKWFLDIATEETGERPEFVALIRRNGGNRLELPQLAEKFRAEGVEAEECDPRRITLGPGGNAMLGDRPIRHAYLKLGMQTYRALRGQIDDFVSVVRSGKLFVQNGQRGRWIGDNKLCLAILSDPSFRHLFDPTVWPLLDKHVPWSRNVGLLDLDELRRIRDHRTEFVLKRPLDTRGRGVVVGREMDNPEEWGDALDVAVGESWLVQEFHLTTDMAGGSGAGESAWHDLAIGLVNGQPHGALLRTSGELRLNVARSGFVHPTFLEQ